MREMMMVGRLRVGRLDGSDDDGRGVRSGRLDGSDDDGW
jgi:hypothetical protein